MTTLKTLSLVTLTLALGAGCDPSTEVFDDGPISLRPGGGGSGGVYLNTSAIGTTPFSEMDFTGVLHDGVRITGVKLKRPNNVWLQAEKGEIVDGNLRAKVGKNYYVGADLVGSRWSLELVDDLGVVTPKEIWISSISVISPKETRYTFQTTDDQGQVQYLCDQDSAGNYTAVAIKDVTIDPFTGDMAPRPSTMYFGCTSGAVGKAVMWGYRPWERTLPEFAAAVRMVRADYCYDGMSWTNPGTALQIKDRWNLNNFVSTTEPTEVVWTTSGVACITQPRVLTYAAEQVTCDGQPIPTCPANLTMTTYAGSQYWTKLAPPP